MLKKNRSQFEANKHWKLAKNRSFDYFFDEICYIGLIMPRI